MLKIMTWKGVKNAKKIYQKILGHSVLKLLQKEKMFFFDFRYTQTFATQCRFFIYC
jgi:uncharacterized protein YabN with tetrapyrrole methylase and pyrophosphatase domain